ncbi:MAG: hypothetical protein PHW41_06680 [Eubacteriales bacterium]|nr:hypothetical protein [Eubacteriales bacterium]
MKKFFALTALVLAGAFLLGGCAADKTSEDLIYRGEVTDISENGDILVTQAAGHNYGQASILFHIGDGLSKDLEGTLAEGAFVEIHYNGILTRSIPAQGTASSITVIASYSEGIVQNGTILSVTPGKDGYSISLLPLGQEKKDDLSNTITLTVHLFALEGLKGEDLVEGLKVSAVTTGIAALSSPPIMQAIALLPYTK